MGERKKFKHGPKRWIDVGPDCPYWYEKTSETVYVCVREGSKKRGLIQLAIEGADRFELADEECSSMVPETTKETEG